MRLRVGGVEKPSATKQELLVVFAALESRIAKLEEHLERSSAFEADPAILAEGEFLKSELSGVEGTEGRS
jgi:hypothetical protein